MAATTVSKMTGMFKEVYGDEVVRAVPNQFKFQKNLQFVPKSQREGKSYNIPVLLTREHGHSFSQAGGTEFNLNGAFSDESQNASVNGAEYVLQCQLSYGAMQRATSKGNRAFADATQHKVKAAVEAAAFMKEYQLLYGAGTAPLTTATGAVDNLGEILTVSDSSGTNTLTLTAASWATALWSGLEDCQLDAYDSDGTQRNTNAALVVSSVDPSTRTVVVTGNTSDTAALAIGDYLRFYGAYQQEMVGACRVASHTSGTLNGINASNYTLWQGSSYAVGGALTFQKVMDGLGRPASLGFSGSMDIYVPTAAWQDINNDQASLRRYTGSGGGKVAQGADELCFYGQTGKVRIIPHILMKQGFALAVPQGKSKAYRIGATDTTFEMPGRDGNIFFHLEGKAAIEMRAYWNQSYFTPYPAHSVLYTGISSSGDL